MDERELTEEVFTETEVDPGGHEPVKSAVPQKRKRKVLAIDDVDDLEIMIDRAKKGRRSRHYIQMLECRLDRVRSGKKARSRRMSSEEAQVKRDREQRQAHARQMAKEQAKGERTLLAEKKLIKLMEQGKAYGFLAECADFMTTEGFAWLSKMAKGVECSECGGCQGEPWAWRLLVRAMEIVASLETQRLQNQAAAQDTGLVDVQTDWPTEGAKA